MTLAIDFLGNHAFFCRRDSSEEEENSDEESSSSTNPRKRKMRTRFRGEKRPKIDYKDETSEDEEVQVVKKDRRLSDNQDSSEEDAPLSSKKTTRNGGRGGSQTKKKNSSRESSSDNEDVPLRPGKKGGKKPINPTDIVELLNETSEDEPEITKKVTFFTSETPYYISTKVNLF